MDPQGSIGGHRDQIDTALEIIESLGNFNRQNGERAGIKAEVLFFGACFLLL